MSRSSSSVPAGQSAASAAAGFARISPEGHEDIRPMVPIDETNLSKLVSEGIATEAQVEQCRLFFSLESDSERISELCRRADLSNELVVKANQCDYFSGRFPGLAFAIITDLMTLRQALEMNQKYLCTLFSYLLGEIPLKALAEKLITPEQISRLSHVNCVIRLLRYDTGLDLLRDEDVTAEQVIELKNLYYIDVLCAEDARLAIKEGIITREKFNEMDPGDLAFLFGTPEGIKFFGKVHCLEMLQEGLITLEEFEDFFDLAKEVESMKPHLRNLLNSEYGRQAFRDKLINMEQFCEIFSQVSPEEDSEEEDPVERGKQQLLELLTCQHGLRLLREKRISLKGAETMDPENFKALMAQQHAAGMFGVGVKRKMPEEEQPLDEDPSAAAVMRP
ncbi:MAG: hypothetical protein K0U23_01975, partial [Gammaproteobacteria bacterium]|nr:hypothetical protein [Gammaproteobacteria bacterium]